MLRIARLTDYAIVVLAHLARPQAVCVHPASDIADATGIPLPTTQKVLKQLARGGFLLSLRGASGGYKLARSPQSITIKEVVEALEGPVGLTACSIPGHDGCADIGHCTVSGHWNHITHAVRNALDAVSIADVSAPVAHRSVAASAVLEEIMSDAAIETHLKKRYEHGWSTDIDADQLPPGLNEGVIRAISAKKEEPEWLLAWRLKAYSKWLEMTEPSWQKPHYPSIDYDKIVYYSAPKKDEDKPQSLDEVDPDLLATFEKLGIPLHERAALAGVAVDAVFDSVSVATTFREELSKVGIIFMSFSEAVKEHPELVKKYLGSVVPIYDNYFAALNSAVFSDGSFVFVPKGVRCPMELSTYFRINAMNTGQFERTLIVVEDGAYVSYLEGCTAPMRDENQLHAAVVELVAEGNGEIKYSTVQNWYPGDENGKGGIYNFVTKRGICKGNGSKISWTQVETGSAITWKYPSVILKGDDTVGEFYSVAVTNNRQQADTGTKMIHLGRNTSSTIISKGISAGRSDQSYRGLVKINKKADAARNYTQCDSLLIGDQCGAHTFPYIEVKNPGAIVEHEATTSKVSDDQVFYLRQRGLSEEDAVNLVVNGFCKEVFRQLPMEFAVEAQKLLAVSLEGSVG